MTSEDALREAYRFASQRAAAPVDLIAAAGVTRGEAWAQKREAQLIATDIDFLIWRATGKRP